MRAMFVSICKFLKQFLRIRMVVPNHQNFDVFQVVQIEQCNCLMNYQFSEKSVFNSRTQFRVSLKLFNTIFKLI